MGENKKQLKTIHELSDSEFVFLTNCIYDVIDKILQKKWSLLENVPDKIVDKYKHPKYMIKAWKSYIFKTFNRLQRS